ncbi:MULTISPECIES: hypothetical protein [Streptococcus]|nr:MULTISPECIES: hypothetical protein [Streptococcus]
MNRLKELRKEKGLFDTDEIMLIDFDKNGWRGCFGEREEED